MTINKISNPSTGSYQYIDKDFTSKQLKHKRSVYVYEFHIVDNNGIQYDFEAYVDEFHVKSTKHNKIVNSIITHMNRFIVREMRSTINVHQTDVYVTTDPIIIDKYDYETIFFSTITIGSFELKPWAKRPYKGFINRYNIGFWKIIEKEAAMKYRHPDLYAISEIISSLNLEEMMIYFYPRMHKFETPNAYIKFTTQDIPFYALIPNL